MAEIGGRAGQYNVLLARTEGLRKTGQFDEALFRANEERGRGMNWSAICIDR